MNKETGKYVLDTSAWLTLIEDEEGADEVQKIIEESIEDKSEIYVSFMTYMEIYYITLQERDEKEARARIELISGLPGLKVESSENVGNIAAQFKAKNRISVADAWIAALAETEKAILVHKDPEFDQLNDSVQLLRLPYKK